MKKELQMFFQACRITCCFPQVTCKCENSSLEPIFGSKWAKECGACKRAPAPPVDKKNVSVDYRHMKSDKIDLHCKQRKSLKIWCSIWLTVFLIFKPNKARTRTRVHQSGITLKLLTVIIWFVAMFNWEALDAPSFHIAVKVSLSQSTDGECGYVK